MFFIQAKRVVIFSIYAFLVYMGFFCLIVSSILETQSIDHTHNYNFSGFRVQDMIFRY